MAKKMQDLTSTTDIALKNAQQLQKLNASSMDQNEIRKAFGDIIGQEIDPSVQIRLPIYSDYGRHIKIGKNVFINSNVMLVDLGGITIGDHVLIGPKVTIASVNHPLNPNPNIRRGLELKPVKIEQNAWLAANSTILPGVTVGENSVIAAGAVVTKDVPANTVVAGVPAKVIKKI